MEVLLFNLSLKRFLFKLDSSQPSSPPAGAARWQHSPPLAVSPASLLDGSLLRFDFSFLRLLFSMCSRDSRSMNAALQNCFCYTLDAVRL
jgi:hypothetical protein